MTYSTIDAVVREWAERNRLVINTQFSGEERRFFYVSDGEQECFQVSIEPPEAATVIVNAWSIETIDDAELHETWTVDAHDLFKALDAALRQIRAWGARPKGAAV